MTQLQQMFDNNKSYCGQRPYCLRLYTILSRRSFTSGHRLRILNIKNPVNNSLVYTVQTLYHFCLNSKEAKISVS